MNKDDTAYLKLILESFDKIKAYVGTMTYDDFTKDGKTQSAVIMQLQVVGELAKTVPEETKKSIDVPWKEIVGLRDLISHQYFRLDIQTIWHTTQESIPIASGKIRKYLRM